MGIALISLVSSLLLVGVISGTFLRHVVQVVPALIAGALVFKDHRWNRMAAIPILAFWLVIMILIWLYVLGVARVVSGRFTTPEVILTIVMGAACIAGLVAAWRIARRQSWVMELITFLLFGAFQFAAMLLSFRPAIANR